MENQKINQKSHIPSILCSTSRQFYTRRVPTKTNNTLQQDKMLKLISTNTMVQKSHRIMKTQLLDDTYRSEEENDNMRKIARVKLENTIKRYGKEWKGLLDCFENYSKSSSRQVLRMNEINFMLKMNEILLKDNRKSRNQESELKSIRSTGRTKTTDNLMEYIKLAKQNEMLRDKINALEDLIRRSPEVSGASSEQRIRPAVENQEGQELPFTSQGYHSLQTQVEVLRQTNDMLREQKKSLYQKVSELKTSNQNLCQEIVKCRFFSTENKQKVQMWKNIMSMQVEQITSLKRDRQQLRNQLILLNRKYQTALKRVKAISNPDQNKLTQITRKNIQVFSEQIQFFQKVKGFGWSKPFYQTTGAQKNVQKEENNVYYKKYLGDKDAVNNTNGVKKAPKQYFRYYKPTFYVFVEQYFEHQGIDKENVGQIQLSLGIRFLATLRSILDAKYNEYLMAKRSVNAFSCLPAFVISWLSNFKIDQKTRKCQQVTQDLNFDVIGSFYVKLMNPYLNGNWEAIAFRQFLLQTSTIDELIFYLTARFKLMKGESMTNSGAYLQTYYVNYLQALFLIQQIVVDFGYRKKLQEYLKRTCEMHRKNQMIDGHFILRLLLEYYQFKKSQTFNQLTKAFYKYSKEFNNHMTFQTYMKIYDYNGFQLTLEQKIQIYQKTFSLGKGIVCIENVFTVINEEGYLCRMVDKMFEKYVIIRENGSHQSVMRMRELMEIEQNLNVFFEKNTMSQISSIGLQAYKREAVELIKSKTLTFDVVFGKIEHMLDLSLFTLKKLFFTKKLRQDEIMMIVPKCFNFLKDLVKATIQRRNSITFAEQFLKKNAARQILNFYRRKKKLKISMMASCEQMDRTQTRAEQVRLEFVNLIQNLKQKYNSSKKTVSENSESDCNDD